MVDYKSFLFFSLAFATGLIFYTIFLLLIYKVFFNENKECENINTVVEEDLNDLSAEFEDLEEAEVENKEDDNENKEDS